MVGVLDVVLRGLVFGQLVFGKPQVDDKAANCSSTSLITSTKWAATTVSIKECGCTSTKLTKVVETAPASSSEAKESEDSTIAPLDIIPQDANIVYHEWNLTERSVTPDGTYRRGFLINGQSPGPLLQGKQGDWVVIKVNNFLTVPTTIHFHGIHQNGTMFSDGVPGVTQYPILSGDHYYYVWKMEQYGFFWYHSHFRGYSNDGLVGPIYISPSDEVATPFAEISEDVAGLKELEKKSNFLLLGDWFKDTYDDMAVKMFGYGMDPTCAQAMLINGKGRHYCFPHETFVNECAVKYNAFMGATQLDTWSADQYGCIDLMMLNGFTSIDYNKTELEFPGHNNRCFNTTVEHEVYWTQDEDHVFFNILNMGGLFSKTLSIDDHKLTVVAIDGNYIKPQTVEQLYMPIGMRFTVVVETKAEDHANVDEPFAIRMQSNDMPQLLAGVAFLQYGSFDNATYGHVQSLGIEHANGAKHANLGGVLLNETYTRLDPIKTTPHDGSLKPPEGAADVTIHAVLKRPGQTTFTILNDQKLDGGMELKFPILFKVQEDASVNATKEFGGAVIDAGIKAGDVVDIVFQNTPIADHPMHLHGHTFWVIASNDSVSEFGYNSTAEALAGGYEFNFEDPAYVDNVAVMLGGYAVVRFVATNTVAMLHCHITTHLTMGMGGVIVEGKEIPHIDAAYINQPHAAYTQGQTPSELEHDII